MCQHMIRFSLTPQLSRDEAGRSVACYLLSMEDILQEFKIDLPGWCETYTLTTILQNRELMISIFLKKLHGSFPT